MQNIIVFSILLFLASCNAKEEEIRNEYSSMYLQRGNFGKSDIDTLLNRKNNISADSISMILSCDNIQKIDTVYLKESKQRIHVKRGRSTEIQFIAYSIDELNLIIYTSGKHLHEEKLYVLQNKKHKKLLYELINNDAFILKILSEGLLQ